jgi:dihydropyrimidine dehydrogenase (NAD+) subunit PreT
MSFEQIHPYMTPTMALQESARCLFCYDAPCIQACPTGIDIPLFIRQIQSGNLTGSARTIYEANYFGNSCGKVCPTEVLCEGACVYNHRQEKPIEIGRLQSYAARHALSENQQLFEPAPTDKPFRVAVIGAGPAGIACACELRRAGGQVDVFEARDLPGGLALHGCAPYKMTNDDVLQEIYWLQKQFGFQLHTSHPIRGEDAWQRLEANYDAIFLGLGLGPTNPSALPGATLPQVIGATEYIARVKVSPKEVWTGKNVMVIGGGNTATDAATEAMKLGASSVTLIYRRSRTQLKAYPFEFAFAKTNGVSSLFNTLPVAILGEDQVSGIRLAQTREEGGRLLTINETAYELPCDMVIMATGQDNMQHIYGEISRLRQTDIRVDSISGQINDSNYFAGGDFVNGGAEVVHAVAAGKSAATGMLAYLSARPDSHQ